MNTNLINKHSSVSQSFLNIPHERVTFEPMSKVMAVATRTFHQIQDHQIKDKVQQMFFEAVKSMYQQIHELCMSILRNIRSGS